MSGPTSTKRVTINGSLAGVLIDSNRGGRKMRSEVDSRTKFCEGGVANWRPVLSEKAKILVKFVVDILSRFVGSLD